MSTAESGKLQGSAALMLAVGVVALEFAAAVSTFVAGTLLPLIERDLSAQRQVPLLLAGGTIGMFAALPVASRVRDCCIEGSQQATTANSSVRTL